MIVSVPALPCHRCGKPVVPNSTLCSDCERLEAMPRPSTLAMRGTYWGISYKRKFFWTLWSLPIAVVVTAILPIFSIKEVALFFLLATGQLAYNFYMWKTREAG